MIDYPVARMEQAPREGHEKLNAELERMRQRKQQPEAEKQWRERVVPGARQPLSAVPCCATRDKGRTSVASKAKNRKLPMVFIKTFVQSCLLQLSDSGFQSHRCRKPTLFQTLGQVRD